MKFHGRWKKNSTRYCSYEGDDILLSMDIISEAYEYSIIDWSTYKKAMGKIRTNLNGSWMFEREIEKRVADINNEYFNETRYMTENMGEITVWHTFATSIYGEYNSEKTNIALIQLVSFEEDFEYFMNLINQYRKIHEITKKAIIENFNNNEEIKSFFYHYNSLGEEELFELFGIKTFDEFDINKAVDKLTYPRLYFENGIGDEKIEFSIQYWVSGKPDIVLEIFTDTNLNVMGFQIE